jgi:hypothetical protein
MIRDRPWDDPDFQIPVRIGEVPGMLTHPEKRMLYWLTRELYTGEGAICDLGAFLGGSTICFLTGLQDRGETRRMLHSYDLWVLGPFELEAFFPDNPPPHNQTFPLFMENTRGFHHLLHTHAGDLLNHRWNGEPIEIVFVDIAKAHTTWDHIVRHFFPSLIPERSIVILQDYLFSRTGPWHHVVMEKLADHFEYVTDTHINSALFRHTRGFPEGMLDDVMWERIPFDEKVALMERAIERMDTVAKREILHGPLKRLRSGWDAPRLNSEEGD